MNNFKAIELRKVIRPVVLILSILIALYAIVHLWQYYNSSPWTRDGRVRGDVVQVSSDISGLVTQVLVQDNQTVKKGQPLFKIDVARQALDVEQAQADLSKAKAGLAQAEANLLEAKTGLVKLSANLNLAEKTAARYRDLMQGAISKQEQDQVFATHEQSKAEYEQSKASIEQAKANVQQNRAQVDVAQSHLNLARLNLNRSEVVAPADGTLSNFDLQAGQYIKTGQAVAALLNRKQLYIVGYFEETKLNKIYIGAPAIVELMGDSQKIKGHVQGVASGIEDRERSNSSNLLANVNPTFSWVRLAQRVPVKIVLDEMPENQLAFVSGRTATVHILE
ncbi:HlyD family secretion protein [Acinetobacter rudis]|uniref:HlyD family secretion protein n=1 Tax=Acinetobacter rudis TaxID=632955 RepID=UPI00280E47B0|nr:HlyD family secretion protein [Acinetobacter rudis]MDQ8954103.1 HlyD family secretion protein [Acinetobacter rudis]